MLSSVMAVQHRYWHPVYLLKGEPGLASIAAGLPVLLCRMLDAVMGRTLLMHSLLGLN